MMGKTIFVTGCSRGLGKLLAEKLAKKNYLVYAGIRDLVGSKELITSWKKIFPNMKPVKLDVTSDDDCSRVVKQLISKEKRLDVLINVVGYSKSGSLEQFSVQDYKNILDTNAIGTFRLIREVVPLMKSRKSGRIINITSLNGLLALPNFGIYCSSKFALEALGLSLRYELARYNVWVTNVEPGAIYNKDKTEKGIKFPHIPVRERFWIFKKLMPMVTEEEVAETIAEVIESPRPPAQVILGRDAQITTFLQRFLPKAVWDRLLRYVWNKQNEN